MATIAVYSSNVSRGIRNNLLRLIGNYLIKANKKSPSTANKKCIYKAVIRNYLLRLLIVINDLIRLIRTIIRTYCSLFGGPEENWVKETVLSGERHTKFYIIVYAQGCSRVASR